jgi:serine/threonine-protein kinase RIO1
MEPLNDDELNRLLTKWEAPSAPASLNRRVFAHEPRGWRRLWAASFRVPVPIAVAAAVLIALWLSYAPRLQDSPALVQPGVQPAETTLAGFEPVAKLEPVLYSGDSK